MFKLKVTQIETRMQVEVFINFMSEVLHIFRCNAFKIFKFLEIIIILTAALKKFRELLMSFCCFQHIFTVTDLCIAIAFPTNGLYPAIYCEG